MQNHWFTSKDSSLAPRLPVSGILPRYKAKPANQHRLNVSLWSRLALFSWSLCVAFALEFCLGKPWKTCPCQSHPGCIPHAGHARNLLNLNQILAITYRAFLHIQDWLPPQTNTIIIPVEKETYLLLLHLLLLLLLLHLLLLELLLLGSRCKQGVSNIRKVGRHGITILQLPLLG